MPVMLGCWGDCRQNRIAPDFFIMKSMYYSTGYWEKASIVPRIRSSQRTKHKAQVKAEEALKCDFVYETY